MTRTCDDRLGVRHHRTHPLRRTLPWPATPGAWKRLVRELCLIATFAVIYEEIRDHIIQAASPAASHALMIVHAEQDLGLFREHAVQSAFIGSDTVIDAFNAYYGGTHFLIPVLVLGFLFLWHPAHYTRARTALAVTTALAFVVFWLYPVAPPRMLPGPYGIVDTLIAPDGSGHFDNVMLNSAGDQYASMPSLHVAWAVWCTLAIWPVVRNRWIRAVAVVYPLLTTLVVVTTGNHFFLDVIAGAALAGVTWIIVTRAGAWLTVQIATRRAHPGHYSQPADLYSLRPSDGRAVVGWMSPGDQPPADPPRGDARGPDDDQASP
jgi:membrane-associated phospholipid phosphatase